jgi:predicted lipoprotein with Yx(FWY)xxD motif/uncharacterized cupredoxin-like copper-binding protein
MLRRLMVVVPLMIVVALVPSLLTAQDDEEGAQGTVGWTQDAELGIYLTDPEGMTLYVFENDEPGRSTCYEDCAENWPPFTAEEPLTLPEGVPGELTLVTRDDGTSQVAYNDWPLYAWVEDQAPGDTLGHGVGEVWFVASIDASVPGATPAAMATPAATGDTTIAVELGEFYFAPETTTLQVGQEYTFVLTNVGVLIHEFVIEPAGTVDEPLETDTGEEAEVEDIGPGETAELTFTFDEPGQYQFSCHIPGHFENGMVVEITVEE